MSGTIRTTIVATALTVAATLTGCTTHEEPPVVLPSTTASAPSGPGPTSPHSPGRVQEQILEAYLGMQNAFAKASETADPDYPDLSRYTAGTALKRLRDGLTSMRNDGLRGRGRAVFQPKVESM